MILPEGTKVLVKPDTAESVTKGGIFIPETVRDEQQLAITRGEIAAMGPSAEVYFGEDENGDGRRKGKVGDRIMFVRYAGSMFKYGADRIEYRFIQDTDIVCCINEELENEMPDTRKSMVK